MKLSALIFFLLLSVHLFAQAQHENWHFGWHVGVNFSSGNPVLSSGSQIETQESCYSQSDASGNLLFYTNGINVWDAANNVMPNGTGLLGNMSSQCMVIPKPGSPNNYFVVVTDAAYIPGNSGLTYSEIDMTLNGGMGDVVSSVKNVQLNAKNGEWISAIPHANCIDIWIVTHGHTTNSNFLAFLVTNSGISATPVVTNIGVNITDETQVVGIMKPNPTGTKIAMTRPMTNAEVFLLDFDKSTGQVTNTTTLFSGTFSDACYGLEFSRSGNRLYQGQFFPPRIFQYDMTASDIGATRTQIAVPTINGEVGQLQIAPNDKIYISYNVFAAAANFIGVINNPEVLGIGCGFVQNGFSLGSGSSVYGLPWYYNPDVATITAPDLGPDLTLCTNSSVELNPNVIGTDINYTWSDGSTGATLNIDEPGTYWVDAQVGSCQTSRDSILVELDTANIRFELSDSIGCSPLSVDFTSIGSPGVTEWNWNLGDGTQIQTPDVSHEYTVSGVYDVTLSALSAAGCALDTTVINAVTVYENPTANFAFTPQVPELDQQIQFVDESVGGIETWLWTANHQEFSNLQNPTYSTPQAASFVVTLTVIDTNGCSDQESKTISFQTEDLLYVPNSFTPDGDGTNDVFMPSDVFGIVRSFRIFNRWGEEIWSAESPNDFWDGTYLGKPAQDGVYTWQIAVELNGIVSDQFEGHVTLVR